MTATGHDPINCPECDGPCERERTYRVHGETRGDVYDEGGFATMDAAIDYASDIIDGDIDGTIEVTKEDPR
jgi:hypothetical protein